MNGKEEDIGRDDQLSGNDNSMFYQTMPTAFPVSAAFLFYKQELCHSFTNALIPKCKVSVFQCTSYRA